MKLNFFLPLLVVASVSSCIQDEPLNMEADIEMVKFDEKDCDFLLNVSDTNIVVGTDDASRYINITKNPTGDITNVTPYFKLTEGASIVHIASGQNGNGLTLDFTEPQKYRVISEDGKWHKDYTVEFNNPPSFTDFEFEHFEMVGGGRYVNYYEVLDGHRYSIWATANPGFAMSGGTSYPTQRYDSGVNGNGVRLRTESTGMFGAALKMPIAAGNLFLGKFDAVSAVTAPLQATKFGMPFNKVPRYFTGYYMFKPGSPMTDASGNVVTGREDKPDFYAVLYENEEIVDGVRKSIILDGSNILDHKSIVAIARISDPVSMTDEQIKNGEWKYFELPFELVDGKTIDREKLKNYGYNIAVVFSSGIDAAYFIGAVGSTLYIDSVKLICE